MHISSPVLAADGRALRAQGQGRRLHRLPAVAGTRALLQGLGRHVASAGAGAEKFQQKHQVFTLYYNHITKYIISYQFISNYISNYIILYYTLYYTILYYIILYYMILYYTIL